MGEHAKLVPKQIEIYGEKIELKNDDYVVQCIPDEKLIFIEGMGKKIPACLVKIFRVDKFNEEYVALWQIAEAICTKTSSNFWGYEDTDIMAKIMTRISIVYAQK